MNKQQKLKTFWKGFLQGLSLGPLWKYLDDKINGHIVRTHTQSGELVAITRQDSEGRVLSIIWQKEK